MHTFLRRRPHVICAAVALAVMALASALAGATRKFYDDDPISREPEAQDASGVQSRDINLLVDLTLNLFARQGDPATNVRARNINTIDEVPDSNWFTNRILARPVSPEEAARGPITGPGPAAGTLTVIRPKQSGDAPGFTARDAAGETWFISFDARGYPEAASGALMVANKIFWTLGYWQVENHLTAVRPDALAIDEAATIRPPSGVRRKMTRADVEEILRRAEGSADGSYRAVAARALPGRTLAGFLYFDTRTDDPNDVVPHEHRRELRALKVFGAWTNLVDMKAGNTLDTLITENGRSVVRHYLQDVGSTFGVGANGPHEYFEGWEHLFEGDATMSRLMSFGFHLRPWQTVPYPQHRAIGRFEGDAFDPLGWKPRVPTAAFLHARSDDTFWAARRVTAFSDELIHAIVKAGNYSDPASADYLADVLIKRRNAIGRAYLASINPIVGARLDPSGALTFQNAASAGGFAPDPTGYRSAWFLFDNTTGGTQALGEASAATERIQAPRVLPTALNTLIKVEVAATGGPNRSWEKPVSAFFRRTGSGWRLIGFERLPED